MEFLAPAKINLSLRVRRKREDGFHEIDTLMAPLSVFDTLDIELREQPGFEFTCSDPTLPVDENNLAVRAARHFCGSFGLQPNLEIYLKKEIPHGAGLGGGSSDAAAVIVALNHLFNTQLPREELVRLAAELGSDIPFFIYQSAARCTGRGEIVQPCELPSVPLLLIKPPFGVPTPWAYRQWSGSREISGVRYTEQPFPWGALVNDLERPVFEKYTQLAEMKRWLLEQPEAAGALMSGSGSTMFALLRDKQEGMAVAERVVAQFGADLWVALTETM